MEQLEIDYQKLMSLIKSGLLRHHKDFFVGALLIRENANTCDQVNWDEKVDIFIDSMAYNIITSLKEHFGKHLMITEGNELLGVAESGEVMKDFNK